MQTTYDRSPATPWPGAAQLPRITSVQMLYFAEEDCWRLAWFAGDEMIGDASKAPATDRRRLELLLEATARVLHTQAMAAREDFAGVLDDDILDGGDIIR